MGQEMFIGEVDRISGSGNAMVKDGRTEYNLGPMEKSVVRQQVLALPLGDWAVCLTPQKPIEQYFKEFLEAAPYRRSKLEQKIANSISSVDSDETDEILRKSGEITELQPESIGLGDYVDLTIAFAADEFSFAILEGGQPIRINFPMLEVGRIYNVQVTDIDSDVMTAILPDKKFKSTATPGDVFAITVESHVGSTAYGHLEGLPVKLTGSPADVGDVVKVAIQDVGPPVITASIEPLPPSDHPTVNDVLTTELHLPYQNEETCVLSDGVPILVTGGKHTYQGEAEVEVTESDRNRILGEVDFRQFKTDEFGVGSTVTVSNIEWQEHSIVGYYRNVPIGIRQDSAVKEIPEELNVTVDRVDSDGIEGYFESHPGIKGVTKESTITVDVKSVENGYMRGSFADVPIWIPFDEPIEPEQLTVQVSDIRIDGLRGTMPSLMIDDSIEPGSVLPAQVSGDHVYAGLAWLDTESGGYSNPMVVPDLFPSDSSVAVALQSQAEYLGEGTIVGWQNNDGWYRLKPGLVHLQRALFATRREAFSEAVKHWENTYKATVDVYLDADARRGACFTAVEDALSMGDFDDAQNQLNELENSLHAELIPDNYCSAIESEITAYRKLVKATKRARSGNNTEANGLQRIAANFGFLPLAKEAIAHFTSAMETVKADDSDFEPVFPHPLAIQRIKQLAKGFEREPKEIHRFIDGSQQIEQLRWSLTLAILNDPHTDEALDVHVIEEVAESDSTISADKTAETVRLADDSTDGTGGIPSSEDSAKLSGPGEPTEPDETVTSERTGVTDEATTAGEMEYSLSESKTESSEQNTTTADSPAHSENRDTNSSNSETSSEEVETSARASDREIDTDVSVNTNREQRNIPEHELRRLRKRAEANASNNPIRDTSNSGGGSRYQRSAAIKEYVKARADGICEACDEPAPFETPNGEPYLEAHHVDELSDGGADHPDKVVAVCPTCHKRIHHGANGNALNNLLHEKLESGLASLGTK
ncbi:HNH endonuclease [Halogeometricum sp. S1BR25-6]|uniref:HNH endonuclease n=1 Tax=Halogeometricum salsisoli TaxID=2950536 RepID=A0ABU2GJI4_9EURY|nr:HNH endonuclease signature motif containing protein [Halogeometricum sp. S1BR25-6]MDS0300935.1 HNH endonuclease [Halogeometricum sp. S1BR25-6]